MMETPLTLSLLVGVMLLIYGVLHGCLNVWVWRNREHLIIPYLLFMTPVGVAGAVLACVPFIGWETTFTVVAALTVSYVPVAAIVGWAILNRKERGL